MQRLLCPNQNIALTASAVQRKILVYPPDYHDRKFGKLWVLGPNYRARCIPFWERIKEEAADHVLRHSQCSLPGVMTIIETVEDEARAAYADDVVNGLTGSQFQKIMVVDGCFSLLLAFLLLGVRTELKFSENHLVFGTGYVNEYMAKCLESMFFVGNQIPFIVIEKLVDLSFFKGIKTTLKCKLQLELGKRTLHKLLTIDRNPKPMDLLHCFQSIMLGPRGGSNIAIGKKDDEIEETVSVTKLSKRGIKFRKLEGELGIRSMHYKCNTFQAVLSLPFLKVDKYTGMLFKCLLKYEIVQEPRGIEPEACYFFKFMREMIRTPQDVEVLESEGVIEGESKSLPAILKSLDGMVSFVNMHCIKREIVGNRPWHWQKLLKWMAFICSTLMFLFALMQMNYGILAYYKKEKP